MQLLPRISDPQQDFAKMQKIDDQWRNLQNLEELPIEEELDLFYCKLGLITNFEGTYLFKELSQFALCVLSLPHSSASCERIFSKVNLIKTKGSNKIITETINGIMHSAQRINLDSGCISFKPTDEMLKSMTSLKMYGQKQLQDNQEELLQEEEEKEIIFETAEQE